MVRLIDKVAGVNSSPFGARFVKGLNTTVNNKSDHRRWVADSE